MTGSRTTSPSEVFVQLDRSGEVALHVQLEQRLREAIRGGRLAGGSVLPSSRVLAGQLGLARGVVVEAYEQLVAEGYLSSRVGSATTVSERAVEEMPPAPLLPTPRTYRIDFAYGSPDVTEFPRAAWLRCMRRVVDRAPAAQLGYLDPRGARELRESLAAYLNRVRGTAANAERTIGTNGFAQGLALSLQVLAAQGVTRIAVEEPGQVDTPEAVALHGLQAIPIPVDRQGIRLDALDDADAGALVLTPAHQFPTGAVLSAERRAGIIAWARSGRRVVIEDDYDAEYRYDREPIGALQGLASEQVIYAGSASKTLAPGLRLGWLIAPARLVQPLSAAKEMSDRGSPSLDQLAFAEFLERGEFDRHLRRMRAVYRGRRDALLVALRRHAPALRPAGASAGLHVVAWLPAGMSEDDVIARAAERDVRALGVRRYRMLPGTGDGGLLFGYGTLAERQIEEGIRLVAEALAAS